jgi:hypothetical protein
MNPAMQGKPFYIAISFTGVAVWQSHTGYGYYLLPPMHTFIKALTMNECEE